MTDLSLRVWNLEHSAVAEIPLGLSEPGAIARVELRGLPGASAIQVILHDAQGVRLRAEVVADPGETVSLQVELDEKSRLHVSSHGRSVLLLPADARYDPAPPIQPAAPDAPLDIAVVVDGTIRGWREKEASGRLLDATDLWTAHVDKLLDFIGRVTRTRDTRVAVLAFGDQAPPAVTAADLRPSYWLYPAEESERVLYPLDADRLRKKLLTVPATSGGDFVDALADALDACARLRWHERARKLVVVTGDSPGASLLYALPKGADLCVRQLDVDAQALTLHRLGVEILTIYHAPPSDLKLETVPWRRDLLRSAQDQYSRLASLPKLAFEAAEFPPQQAAERFDQIAYPIARGAALGALVRVMAEASDDRRFSRMQSEATQPHEPPGVHPAGLEVAGLSADETVKRFGDFAVKEIGRGAMAVVYESVKDERVIAIKCMSERALRDPDNRRRFQQEAEVSLGLNHPNIVRFYGHGEIEGVPYLLMERLYGQPLKASIDAHKRFAPRDAARIAMQLAEALDYTHRSHVYHRDLKPDNIMMVDNGNTAKIMDFGIAVTPDTDRQTKTGMVIGTPRYMSPDRITGGEATPQSDLYALGLILYEMLTGQDAVTGRLRVVEDHPRASIIIPELPPRLDDIVAKLLARDGSAGYESARHLLDDLKEFVGPGG